MTLLGVLKELWRGPHAWLWELMEVARTGLTACGWQPTAHGIPIQRSPERAATYAVKGDAILPSRGTGIARGPSVLI